LREGHAHLKSDTRLLWYDADRANLPDRSDDAVEQGANFARLAAKMVREIMSAAGVRLITIGERSAALTALPQRSALHRPNETKLSHRWRHRAFPRSSMLKSCES